MKAPVIRIVTRKSPLALWQAHFVRDQIQFYHPYVSIDIIGLTTQGDRHLESSLAKIGGKGLFVKELETALLEDKADIAVHSLKDLPMDLPSGLKLGVVCQREDPRDVLVSKHKLRLSELPHEAIIGTSSLRRQSQLKAIRPDLNVEMVRGNIETRLTQLKIREYDALILAAAGLIRLEKTALISDYLSVEEFLPACGQGALGIEYRKENTQLDLLLAPLNHQRTMHTIITERAMCRRLGSGCQVPVGAYAIFMGDMLSLRGFVGMPDGSQILKCEKKGEVSQCESLGESVAEELLKQGADNILKACS